MNPQRWEALSGWLNAWLEADASGRTQLRVRLAAEHPDLVDEADGLMAASGELAGFLETPALVLEARALAREDAALPPGTMVGPYRVTGLLARGGMGDVYRATDERLQRDVALKVLAKMRTSDPHRVERFLHEARVTAGLDHQNIVRIFDVGRFEDYTYLVAELLEGETLRARIDRGPLAITETLLIALEITRGLAAAHAAGLVHRDLKPDNIFLTRSGATRILDFGIAKLAQDDTVQHGFSTLTGVVLGTVGYLSPEQITGKPVDARADLFAMGALIFELLTGRRAFAREHLVETLHAILHDPPLHALSERSDVPPALAAIVMRLLEKRPEARLQSAAELIDALEAVDLAEGGGRAHPVDNGASWTAGDLMARAFGTRALKWAASALIAAAGLLVALWFASSQPALKLAIVTLPAPSAGPNQEMVEIGLAGEIISRLSQVGGVEVLSLTATTRLRREADPVEAARRLGATHILTLTLHPNGDTLHAMGELHTVDHRAIMTIPPFPSDRSRLFEIRDFVVTRTLDELVPRLSREHRSRLTRTGTANSAAYEAYVHGQALVLNPTSTNLLKAAELFTQASTLDPAYADAWAGLGTAYKRMEVAAAGVSDPLLKARAAANKALQLHPDHPEALSVLGTVAFWYDWDYDESERLLRRALSLRPSFPDAQLFLAHVLSNVGRHEEAIQEIRRARALDPGWPLARALHGQFLAMSRDYDGAIDHLDAMIRIAPPDFWTGHLMRVYALLPRHRYSEAIAGCDEVEAIRGRVDGLESYNLAGSLKGYAMARMGRSADAEAMIEQLRRRGASPVHEGHVRLGLRQYDQALARFSEAVDGHDMLVVFFGVDPKFDELRDRPEFKALLNRINLLEVSERTRRSMR